MPSPTIYLDNAATTWPKPPSVLDAIIRYYQELGVAAHRGSSAKAAEVDRTIEQCRNQIAQLINARSSEIVFCFNGTDGLNLAIHGLIETGNKVITTGVEHNSVLRPLFEKTKTDAIDLKVVGCLDGVVDMSEFKSSLHQDHDACVISHVSNVTGQVQPVEEIAEICKQNNVLLIVDACQSIGHMHVDFEALGADVLISSGHKGLMGPLGTGFLCLKNSVAEKIRPWRMGGTGTRSESIEQPNELPVKLEAGNLNVGGIFGLLAGLKFVTETGIERISQHQSDLVSLFKNRFAGCNDTVFYDSDHNCTGLTSFNLVGHEPQTVASILDSAFGIQVRSGLHCAPLVHRYLGTESLGGTIRVSPGIFNTRTDMELLGDAIEEILQGPSFG